MQNASLFQFLLDVLSPGGLPKTAGFLRQILRDQDVGTENEIEHFFLDELKNTPFQTEENRQYFQWITCASAQYAQELHREAFFSSVLETIEIRLPALNQAGANAAAWQGYLNLAKAAVGRCLRQHALEVFESAIDDIDWDLYESDFIRELSILIGQTYLEEDDKGRKLRARIWLQKAWQEAGDASRLGAIQRMARYYYDTNNADEAVAINDLKAQVEAMDFGPRAADLKASAIIQLGLMATHLEIQQDELNSNQKNELLSEARLRVQKAPASPGFALVCRNCIFGRAMAQLEASAAKGYELLEKAVRLASEKGLEHQGMYARLDAMEVARLLDKDLLEKDLKELIAYFKRQEDNITYLRASRLHAFTLTRMAARHRPKTHEVLMDVIRRGIRKVEKGGFFLISGAVRLANDVYLPEIPRPGISWATGNMDEFFGQVIHVIDQIDAFLPFAGRADVDIFRNEYLRMEPASYLNIKTYFRYQYYAVKMLGLSARLMEDEVGVKQAEVLAKSLADHKNPLNFVMANWKGDFKDVAHDVRNKTINRCINISKGDLPLAAEHLDDFSYRNLRSYITFNEVHRLGFFMETHTTSNRQLEHAIRLLMHDLYESGQIFEVVFDIPRFLVDWGDGFYAEDMEQEMELKATTAKKYINVMVDHGFLIKDKSRGRRHFFYLDRDKVMKRLASDSSTLIDPS
ncbi:MAG: hypothetical protein R3B47_17050 [Bacteroidia bacterium]